MIGEIINGVASLANVGGGIAANVMNQRNFEQQQEFAREQYENGIQTKVKDAEAAGLSPLAVLGASGAQAPVISAPQMTNPIQGIQQAGEETSQLIHDTSEKAKDRTAAKENLESQLAAQRITEQWRKETTERGQDIANLNEDQRLESEKKWKEEEKKRDEKIYELNKMIAEQQMQIQLAQETRDKEMHARTMATMRQQALLLMEQVESLHIQDDYTNQQIKNAKEALRGMEDHNNWAWFTDRVLPAIDRVSGVINSIGNLKGVGNMKQVNDQRLEWDRQRYYMNKGWLY